MPVVKGDSRISRDDLPLIVRLAAIGLVAYLSASFRSSGLSVALVLCLVVAPLSVLVPKKWRGQIGDSEVSRGGLLFLPGLLGVFVAAFGDSQGGSFPTTALVMAFGSFHMFVVWLTTGPAKSDIFRSFPWLGACMLGIIGISSDLPTVLGWNTLAFFVYGFTGALAFQYISTVGATTATDRP